jgi:thymidylate kinase
MKKLYIFEGPDGGGKTTVGNWLAGELKIPVSNHGPYTGEQEIWRHYFNSMLPALAGERAVILDRCWLAEPIYGEVYRRGLNRLKLWQLDLLEHIAGRCNAIVIWCMPPVEKCVAAFNSRRGDEYLDNDQQLRKVYQLYGSHFSKQITRGSAGLSHMVYDYTDEHSRKRLREVLP